jgi:mannose-6-phosphate isomerase
MSVQPTRLIPSYREKIWGVTNLEPWFGPPTEKIGEVWFLTPGPDPLPILVKLIFTSELLSVQVHPDNEYAWSHGDISGKTEMWYILRAEPGAQLALGFRETITRERLREVSVSGEIEQLLQWFPVSPGQAYFVPPRTVHALGPGITLCEIQQNADITYRLYDYGRPRELHLEKAVGVSNLGPHPGPLVPEGNLLASCDYFVTEQMDLESAVRYQPDPEHLHLLVVLEGRGLMGEERFAAGEVWMVPSAAKPFSLAAEGKVRLLRTYLPGR